MRRSAFPNRLRLALVAAAAVAVTLALGSRAEAFVYWTNLDGPTISRANNDGTGIEHAFITGAQHPCDVTVDDSHIYWANHDNAGGTTIGRADIDGGNVDQQFITGANGPCGVAVDESFIYWNNTAIGTIGRADLDGDNGNQSFIDPAGIFPCGLAVTDTRIYWADEGSNSVGRANIDGTGANDSYITGADEPCGVAVNSAHIYWANTGDTDPIATTLGRANLDGSAVNQSFIGGGGSPCGVALDDSHIYWANMNFGVIPFSVGRANLNGSGVQQHFIDTPGDDFPCGVAVDSGRRSTAVVVDCSPAAAALLQPTTCTANVSDTNSGPDAPPTGTVSFSSSAGGSTFTGGSDCTLLPTPGGTGACSVTYRPGFGSNLLLALYRGDATHEESDAVGGVTVGPFSLGAVTLNRRNGTARLAVTAPGPGTVTLLGLATQDVTRQLSAAGQVALPVVGTTPTRRKLRRRGRAGVFLAVRYEPAGGGSQDSELTSTTLIKKKKKRKRRR